MGDADDAVVMDALVAWWSRTGILQALKEMPDKGPLARSLGITPGDLGLERTNPQWVNDRPVWVEP